MSRAIDDLMNEHDAILSALKILRAIAQRVAAGQPTEAEDIAAFIGFLKEFADKCHHGKEEGILFPMADKLLSPGQLEDLYEAFEAYEAHVIGAGRHEQLHALLSNLKEKYQVAT